MRLGAEAPARVLRSIRSLAWHPALGPGIFCLMTISAIVAFLAAARGWSPWAQIGVLCALLVSLVALIELACGRIGRLPKSFDWESFDQAFRCEVARRGR